MFPVFGAEMGDPYLGIEAYNSGRSPAEIRALGIGLSDKRTMTVMSPEPWALRLPLVLEPGTLVTFYIRHDEVRRCAAEQQVPFKAMRPFVRLAGGRIVDTRGVPLK